MQPEIAAREIDVLDFDLAVAVDIQGVRTVCRTDVAVIVLPELPSVTEMPVPPNPSPLQERLIPEISALCTLCSSTGAITASQPVPVEGPSWMLSRLYSRKP